MNKNQVEKNTHFSFKKKGKKNDDSAESSAEKRQHEILFRIEEMLLSSCLNVHTTAPH